MLEFIRVWLDATISGGRRALVLIAGLDSAFLIA
jgi:hypothetical protein